MLPLCRHIHFDKDVQDAVSVQREFSLVCLYDRQFCNLVYYCYYNTATTTATTTPPPTTTTTTNNNNNNNNNNNSNNNNNTATNTATTTATKTATTTTIKAQLLLLNLVTYTQPIFRAGTRFLIADLVSGIDLIDMIYFFKNIFFTTTFVEPLLAFLMYILDL